MAAADDQERRALGMLTTVLAIAALTSLLCAAIAGAGAPWVPDLYNIVYHDTRPQKGESTAMFLFVFPTFLTIGWAMIAMQLRGWLRVRRSPMPVELQIIFGLLWSAFFFLGSLHRSWLVYTNGY